MADSEGLWSRSTTKDPPDGYTPYNVEEAADMRQLLASTLSPALSESIAGSLVTVTTGHIKATNGAKRYSTLATLSYGGKKWAGGAKGKWKPQVYKLLSFRYVRAGFRGQQTTKFKVWWGSRSRSGGEASGIGKCPIGKPAFHSYHKCVRAISDADHRKKKVFIGKTVDIVTQFHLDHCKMVSALDGQVASLVEAALSDSEASQEDGGEDEASSRKKDTPSFFVPARFTCSGNSFKKACRDFCSRMGTGNTATTFQCATCQGKCTSMRVCTRFVPAHCPLPLTAVLPRVVQTTSSMRSGNSRTSGRRSGTRMQSTPMCTSSTKRLPGSSSASAAVPAIDAMERRAQSSLLRCLSPRTGFDGRR
jgi:hypothetical protein